MLGAVDSLGRRSDGPRKGSSRLTRAARRVSIWGVLLVALAIVAAAQAQAPEDPEAALDDPGRETGTDTQYTPVAKETQLWTRVAGAEFGQQGVPGGSPTPISADFFAVAFRNLFNGLIGGDRCETADAGWDELETCARVPVVYRYTQEAGSVGELKADLVGTGPGYVAAVAWLDGERALAVGGSGAYPRREPAGEPVDLDPDDPAAASVELERPDPAGEGRAWLYERGSWRELDLPDGMGALTALDVSDDPEACGAGVRECGFAGGLREIWRYEDGEFTEQFTPTATDEEGEPTVTHGDEWRFRVRDLLFWEEEAEGPTAVAVTSGCCALNPADNVARVLVYDGEMRRWDARLLFDGKNGAVGQNQTLPESYFAATSSPVGISVLATPGGPERKGEPASRIVGPVSLDDNRPEPPDPSSGDVPKQGDVLDAAAYGGRAAADTGFSVTYGVIGFGNAPSGNTDVPAEAANPRLSSLRLVAGDGDQDHGPGNLYEKTSGLNPDDADGLMDWAVGVIGSSGQGVAATSAARAQGLDPSPPLACPGGVQEISTECEPDPAVTEEGERSRSVFKLPTYALNGFQLIGSSGVGWAVGDKGAVTRLGGEGALGSVTPPPPPPRLGQAKPTEAASSEPYDGFRKAEEGPAPPVPALAGRPQQQLESPRFVAGGSPDTRSADEGLSFKRGLVREIVMSRDGSEGWAIGPGDAIGNSFELTLNHYDGTRWQRCRFESMEGVFEPDEACAELVPLWEAGVKLLTAERVPLERDDDPTNDDEFEVVAVGTAFEGLDTASGKNEHVVVRYRDGRWSIDEKASAEIEDGAAEVSLAFTRPDDGWLLVAKGGATSDRSIFLYHYDGADWTLCEEGNAECGDEEGAIPYETSFGGAPRELVSAGQRLYMALTRFVGERPPGGTSGADNAPRAPIILYKDPGEDWTTADGGYDPASNPEGPAASEVGDLHSFSVVQDADGAFSGWAIGAARSGTDPVTGSSEQLSNGPGVFLRLDAASGEWGQVDPAAIREYLPSAMGDEPEVLSLLDQGGGARSVLALATGRNETPRPLLTDRVDDSDDWQVMPTPFTLAARGSGGVGGVSEVGRVTGEMRALAPDNQGGFWIAAEGRSNVPSTYFYHWTGTAPEPVFDDVAHPIREPITSAASDPDGRVWVTTESQRLYQYDRVTGWSAVPIAGWDAGRVTTSASEANAVAVGADGSGVVAGENGRIATIEPGGGVQLELAAKLQCGGSSCSTTQDLYAAAVAPDGSAMVGGDRRSLAWRPAGGEFHSIDSPPTSLAARITGISMPSADRAWVATDTGDVFGGQLAGGEWTWRLESLGPGGDPLTQKAEGSNINLPLSAISVDAEGLGYAVGADGLLIERDPEGGASPWRRLDSGYLDDFHSLFYEPGGAMLVGGENGLVLTGNGESLEVANQGDYFNPFSSARSEDQGANMVAVTAAPGPDGASEAWAFSQASSANGGRNPAPGRVLHFSSDSPEARLQPPERRAEPLADVAAPASDALSVAVFGKSECRYEVGPKTVCAEPTGSNLANEVGMQRTVDEVIAGSKEPRGAQLALFTGDVAGFAGAGGEKNLLNSPIDRSVPHNRWAELVAEPLAAAGVPTFAAIGGGDLSHTEVCTQTVAGCTTTHESGVGPNVGWRRALASTPAPWGSGDPAGAGELSAVPVSGSPTATEAEDVSVEDPSGTAGKRQVPAGGANTHYAFDLVRDGRKLARVAVVDNSLGSLAASDGVQNPLEAKGQAQWLRDVLCKAPGRAATTEPCTRGQDQPAIVLTNTPSYAYRSEASGGGLETAADAATFEQLMLESDVNLVVSGRLGWNGLYYTCAAGVHEPGPDGSYPEKAPQAGGGSPCGSVLSSPPAGIPTGLYPTVVSSSAGGNLAPGDSGASQGFWRGYSIVHLPADGNPRKTIVEQRPVFDWVGITAGTHVLRAGQRVQLRGEGREPVGMDQPARYDAIESPAITHRYDLLEADPDRPWMPRLAEGAEASAPTAQASVSDAGNNPCAPYVCLDPEVGSVDDQTGEVEAGDGQYPRTFAVAMLSVGEKAATYPLVFEPRPSFRIAPSAPAPPPPAPASPPPPPPSSPTPPVTPTPTLNAAPIPPPPVLVPPIVAASPGPPPPAPPAPPPPPPAQGPGAPAELFAGAEGIAITPQTTVPPPPPPPVNPAPPGGARKEAKQRQAAVQKGEEGAGSGEGSSEAQEQAGDLAQSPNETGTAMSRHEPNAASRRERTRPEPSFSTLSDSRQLSTWSRGALYAGGTALMALVLALGFSTLRPGPRRRPPEVPAPVWVRNRRP